MTFSHDIIGVSGDFPPSPTLQRTGAIGQWAVPSRPEEGMPASSAWVAPPTLNVALPCHVYFILLPLGCLTL